MLPSVNNGHYYHLVWGIDPAAGLKTQLSKINVDLRDVVKPYKCELSQLKCQMTGSPSLAGANWGIIVHWDGAPGTYYYNKGDSSYEVDTQLDLFAFSTIMMDYTDHVTLRSVENRSGYLNFWLTYTDYKDVILSVVADANWEFHLSFYVN